MLAMDFDLLQPLMEDFCEAYVAMGIVTPGDQFRNESLLFNGSEEDMRDESKYTQAKRKHA